MKYPLWFFVCYVYHVTQQTNQELLEKYVCIKVATMKSADSAARPSYHLKLKYRYPFRFSVSYSMFNSLHSILNQELFEKNLCNQVSHYEKYEQFPSCNGSHHMQQPNERFSLSGKMNGTQRRTLVSP